MVGPAPFRISSAGVEGCGVCIVPSLFLSLLSLREDKPIPAEEVRSYVGPLEFRTLVEKASSKALVKRAESKRSLFA